MRFYFIMLLVLFSFSGCGERTKKEFSIDPDSTFTPRYATGFKIDYIGKSSLITVLKPWQQAREVKRIFLKREDNVPDGFDGIVVEVPLESIVSMSTSYSSFISALGCVETIKGVSGVRYTTNKEILDRYNNGQIKDVGIDSALNYELLASLRVNVVFVYGVSGESSVVDRKMQELGVKIAYVGDYLESSALGKAEWIIFFGEFFNKQPLAQSIFSGIAERYNNAKDLVRATTERPSVMLNAPWRDSWFVPGDKSYMVGLINDAGAEYICAGEDSDQSRPLSSESAFLFLNRADFWLNPNSVKTKAELASENPRFINTKAVKNNRVFNNNLRTNDYNGSDFWEQGVIEPDVVLMDLIKIFHPEKAPNHQLEYYRQVK